MAHRFTCGERKTCKNIKKSQNIMKMIVAYLIYLPKKCLTNNSLAKGNEWHKPSRRLNCNIHLRTPIKHCENLVKIITQKFI